MPFRLTILLGTFSGLLACGLPARADSWIRPTTRTYYSPSSNYFARITPGIGRAFEKEITPAMRSKCAVVELFAHSALGLGLPLWMTNSLNPVMPATVQISDQGHVVLLDNWHSVGHGQAFTLFDPTGRLVRSVTRQELLGTNQITGAYGTISSFWWHSGGRFGTGAETNLFILKLGAKNFTPPAAKAVDDGVLLINLQHGLATRRFKSASASRVDAIPTSGAPLLSISLTNGIPRISWPSISAGFQLQETSDLQSAPVSTPWANSSLTASDNGTVKSVTSPSRTPQI